MRLASRIRLAVIAALTAGVLVAAACGSGADETPLPLCNPEQPTSFPYVFSGTFTVNGEPGPADMPIFARLGDCRGLFNNAPREGEYTNVSIAPGSADDAGGEITFYLGAPDGKTVKANETYTFNVTGQPQLLELNLTFPKLP